MKQLRFWSACWIGLLLGEPLFAQGPSPSEISVGAIEKTITLSAKDLFEGLEAIRILSTPEGLAVDTRSQTEPPMPAQITTDVIDLGGNPILTDPIEIVRCKVTLKSNARDADAIEVQLRSGTSFFQHDGTWSDWSVDTQDFPIGRYVQLRILVPSQRESLRVKSATLIYSCRTEKKFRSTITLLEQNMQQIVRATIPFGYQNPGHPDLLWLRETFQLEKITAKAPSEFEKVNALCTWVSSRKNDRHEGWNTESFYPWNVRKLLDEKNGGTIYGHCASYCSVFLACCQSLGWQARHFAVEGYRENCHEVAEVYINALGRWIYFDASLATYYRDRVTDEPLDILQMHDIYLAAQFNQPGDTVPNREFDYAELDRRRSAIDWQKFPGQPVSEDWIYGEKNVWDWTKAQGILTTAWLQMTPRSNFHDHPQPVFRDFGEGPTGECGFPTWVDSRTPPRSLKTHEFFSRRRDFYWTLNQASFRLERVEENAVRVELGNSQPFFCRYQIVANGKTSYQSAPYFRWTLQPGTNLLRVQCEDQFGKTGVPSQIVLAYDVPQKN